MGTNYYAHCERVVGHGAVVSVEEEVLHIGKSSGGWCFSLHVIPEKGLDSLTSWMTYLVENECVIKDEYGDIVSVSEMVSIIVDRRGCEGVDLSKYLDSYSEIGPNNLLRHKLDGKWCVGHGEGTWDLIAGEFC